MRQLRSFVSVAALVLSAGVACAQFGVGTGFTYQGQLNVSGVPANGSYDVQFRLLDSFNGGSQVGPTIARTGVSISKGLFTQTLDFGSSAFNGSARWLEISVRPTGPGAYTLLSPLQPLSPAPYAIGVSLPLSETLATTNTLLSLTQTAGNNAGAVAGTVINGSGTAVYGQASGTGIGVWGYNLGTGGNAGFFRTENLNNADATVLVQGVGSGPAVQSSSNIGIAGRFDITNPSNGQSVVQAITAGTGRAGTFQNTNANSGITTLYATNNGLSNAFAATNTGTGRGGLFQVLNAASAAAALEASTTGTGLAGKFTGNVDVAGKITTTYGNGGQHRAAPIAFGSFSLLEAGASTLSSSGNTSVSYLGNDTYRINVFGQSSPDTWIVVANVAYYDPAGVDTTYAVRVGVADAQGRVPIYAPCDSGCGAFSTGAVINYVIYQP